MASLMPSPPVIYKKSPCFGQEVHFHGSIIYRTKRTKRTFPWVGKNIFSNRVRAYGYFCTASSVFLLCHSLALFINLFYNRGEEISHFSLLFFCSARLPPCGILMPPKPSHGGVKHVIQEKTYQYSSYAYAVYHRPPEPFTDCAICNKKVGISPKRYLTCTIMCAILGT